MVDSIPERRATRFAQPTAPKGVPRLTLCRTALNSLGKALNTPKAASATPAATDVAPAATSPAAP